MPLFGCANDEQFLRESMGDVKVKFKMTPEQFNALYSEYLDLSIPNRPYFVNFQAFLDWKFSELIDKKIDEVINAK